MLTLRRALTEASNFTLLASEAPHRQKLPGWIARSHEGAQHSPGPFRGAYGQGCRGLLDVYLRSDGLIQGGGIFGISMKLYGQWWRVWTNVEGTQCFTRNGVACWWSEIPLKWSHPNPPCVLQICITKWATSCITMRNLTSALTLRQLPQQKQPTKFECWGEKKIIVLVFWYFCSFVSTRQSLQGQFGALGQDPLACGLWLDGESWWHLAESWKSKLSKQEGAYYLWLLTERLKSFQGPEIQR